jgi:hypothetical protein
MARASVYGSASEERVTIASSPQVLAWRRRASRLYAHLAVFDPVVPKAGRVEASP